MNDFLKYILDHLGGALTFAAVAALAALAAVAVFAVIFRVKYHGERKFPLGRAVAVLALAGCTASILYLTLLRTEEGAAVNLHLFRAWREAWNTFEFKPWANVLLNVLMFVPFGALLPLSFKVFRRTYVSFAVVLAMTSLIETAQLVLKRGTFDVDDIFCNALGGAVGLMSAMAILTALEKGAAHRARRALLYAEFPIAATLAICSIFIVYYAQPYGNLASAPAYRLDMSGVEWDIECPLSDERVTAPVYRAQSLDKKGCETLARELLSRLGMTDELEASGAYYVDYYDNAAYFSCQTVGSVMVEMKDGSYTLSSYGFWGSGNVSGLDRDEVEALLSEVGIDVPTDADFEENDDGYLFTLERGCGMSCTLLCRVAADDDGAYHIKSVDNTMTDREHVADEKLISQSEAMERIKRGSFCGSARLADAGTLTVSSCELGYELDSKGFYRPVWVFDVGGDRVTVEG